MTFADIEFYTEDYLKGRQQTIPTEEFDYWAEKSSNRIDRKNSIDEELIEGLDERTLNQLKMATCEIADIYFKDMQTRSLDARKSVSNQGYSVSFVDQIQSMEQIEANIKRVIISRLSATQLHDFIVFGGV